MMRRGRQAADDGSFARSVGVHTARGALLIGIAVVLGLLLLQKVDSGKSAARVKTETPTTETPTSAPASTTSTRPPSAVKVLVANGTNTNGVALAAQREIAKAGYNALAATDATAAAKAARRPTTVYYAPGYDTDARKIALLLGLPTAPPTVPIPATGIPVSDLKGANVLVVVGPDYAAKQTGATTAPASTTTTRRL